MAPGAEDHCSDDGRHGVLRRRPSACAPLSLREDQVLDEIEHDLAADAPGLFARMSQLADPPPVSPWARLGGGLAFGSMLLVFVVALPAGAAWALVGLVAVAALLPWMLSGVAGRPRRL